MQAVPFIREYCGLDLRPFQVKWLTELFREKDGERVYSQALWGVPRGNGKTEICAAVALYMLVADRPRAEVYIAAGSRDQAALAFKAARRMVEDGKLAKRVRVLPGYRRMEVPATDSTLHIISADGPLQHGLQPSCVIFDELHVQKKRDLFEALVGGLIKRDQALLVCISTAGYDQTSLLAQECKRGEAGADPRFFYEWHTAPESAPYDDPKTWRKANPALRCRRPFMRLKGLEDDLQRMHESEFRRWHLNQWTASDEAWINGDVWDACDGAPELLPERATVLGVDASIRHDCTVVCTVQRDEDGVFHAAFKVWGPHKEIDLEVVMAHIRDQAARYRVTGVAYDPQYMRHAAQRLDDEGLPMVEWKQDNARMVPATRALHEAVINGNLRHGADEVAREHALAAGIAETERGLRLKKTQVTAGRQMDAIIALAMAVDWASRTVVERRSVYEDRDLVGA
jgi:phage terminase large subunit-like protein